MRWARVLKPVDNYYQFCIIVGRREKKDKTIVLPNVWSNQSRKDTDMNTKLIFVIATLVGLFSSAISANAQTQVAQGAAVGYVAPLSAQIAPVERPQRNVGDTWTWSYNDTRYGTAASQFIETVDSVTAEKSMTSWRNPGVNMSGNISYDKDYNMRLKDYTYTVFTFPLAVGDESKFEYDNTDGSKQWHQKVTRKVVGIEEVKVPAGTFTAVKIVLVRDYTGSMPGYRWNGILTDTWWYAPQTKNMVKRVVVDECNACGSFSNSSPLIRELQKYTVQ